MSFDPKDFYFSNGLYQKVKFTEENFKELFNLIFTPGRLDLYCPVCQKETTFEAVPKREQKETSYSTKEDIYRFDEFDEKLGFKYFSHGRKLQMAYTCTRIIYSGHTISFQMIVEQDAIMKIGQYPSMADWEKDETKRYENILSKEYRQELNKAVGLFSHGIGIGSFVYLRRIFERLIYESYNEHQQEIGVDKNTFNSLRMADKIESLKNYLPKTLVEKRAIYSILSKGIHSLDENTCKEFFPVVRAGIEFILDEKIDAITRRAKEAQFNSEFDKLLKKSK
jgi:hypothetical protein